MGAPFRGHEGPVTCVAFPSDGRKIVPGSADKTCRLWDVQTVQPLGKPYIGHSSAVTCIAFDTESRDDLHFHFGSVNEAVRSRSVSMHNDGGEIKLHEKKVNSDAFSHALGTKILVTASDDGTIRHLSTDVAYERVPNMPPKLRTAHERARRRSSLCSGLAIWTTRLPWLK